MAIVRSLKVNVGLLQVDGGALVDSPEGSEAKLDDAFVRPLEELRTLANLLGNRRIAVLIDDLDRCSPENVVGLLQAINLVTDIPGFIYVLALDYDVLVRAIGHRYPHLQGNDRLGHQFIEKMVQLPFRVPPLELDRDDVLSALVPGWATMAGVSPGFVVIAKDIATLGLDANPRRIKRFVNAFLLSNHIALTRNLGVDLNLWPR